MKDIIPSWLEDPSAYAQPANLDMSTVIVVALTNLWCGVMCVAFFEVFRRRSPRIFSPKAMLCPGTTPSLLHVPGKPPGSPLSWIRPLMRLDEEDILKYGGYDVLIYLRFMSLSLKIFGSFAPYAFCVLLPVNASVSYWPGDKDDDDGGDDDGTTSSKDNTFNRLSMSAMPVHDKRMWAHCFGCLLLTVLSMHFLARECRWYTRLRHRFLTQRGDVRQRTILVRQVPKELKSSDLLASYFAKLYPGKVVGAVVCRSVATLDRLLVEREAAAARLDRCAHRRAVAKAREGEYRPQKPLGVCGRLAERAHMCLEDAYDPLCVRCVFGVQERMQYHAAAQRSLDERIARERRRMALADALVGRPRTSADAEADVENPVVRSRSRDGLENVSLDGADHATDDDDDDMRPGHTASISDSLCNGGADDEESDAASGRSGGVIYEEWAEETELSFGDRLLVGFGLKRERDIVERASLLEGASGPPRREMPTKAPKLFELGFVTFNAFTGAAVATQVFHAATPGGMVASMAPETRDVFWKNVGMSSKQRTTRRVVADCFVVLLLVFYIIPVTLISLVFSEQALKAHWPALKDLASDSLVMDACIKMVQPMALIALMLLLPPMFLGLGFWEGTLSWSENTLNQLSRYYSFQITNVLLVTTIAGSLVKCMEKILDNPKATLTLLGESLPQVCAFFSCYIFIKVFAGLNIELCRAVSAVQQSLKRVLYPSATPRDQRAEVLGLRDFENPGWFSYGKYGAQDLLVVVLLMTYCVMSPIILVPGLLFFGWASVVYRHQLLYVYEPIFESGGLLWPRIYRRTLFSIFIMQFTMTGMFFLKHAFSQGYCVLALSVLTYLYKMQMRSMYTTSSSVAHHLPMELATSVDEQIQAEAKLGKDDIMLAAGLRSYLQPGLRG